METIIASLIGVVGVVLSALVFWVGSAVKDLRVSMDARFEKVDERFEKVDERFDRIDAVLRQHGERTARIEGALGASGIIAPPPLTAQGEPAVETSPAEAATG